MLIHLNLTQWITRVPGLSAPNRSATLSLFAKRHDPGLTHHRHPAHTADISTTSKSFWLHYCDSSSPVDQLSSGHLSCCGVHRQPLVRDLALFNNWFIIHRTIVSASSLSAISAFVDPERGSARHKYSTVSKVRVIPRLPAFPRSSGPQMICACHRGR